MGETPMPQRVSPARQFPKKTKTTYDPLDDAWPVLPNPPRDVPDTLDDPDDEPDEDDDEFENDDPDDPQNHGLDRR